MVKRGSPDLDQGAVLEVDLVEIAGDAGADLDLVDRLEAADEIVLLDDVLHDRLGDGDRRRGRRLREDRPMRRDQHGAERSGGKANGLHQAVSCRGSNAAFV